MGKMARECARAAATHTTPPVSSHTSQQSHRPRKCGHAANPPGHTVRIGFYRHRRCWVLEDDTVLGDDKAERGQRGAINVTGDVTRAAAARVLHGALHARQMVPQALHEALTPTAHHATAQCMRKCTAYHMAP